MSILKNYDSKLKEIVIFNRYPSLLPHIGEGYRQSHILLLAESFYFPYDEITHQDPDIWYQNKEQDITEINRTSVRDWFDCRALIKGPWDPHSGHRVYIEKNSKLKNNGYAGGLSDVAFTNTFFRPAMEGQSIQATSKDCEVSIQTICKIIDIIQPKIVVFISKKSWDNVGYRIREIYAEKDIVIDFTNHPASRRHWHGDNGYKKLQTLLSN